MTSLPHAREGAEVGSSRAAAVTRFILDEVFAGPPSADVAVRLWDGTEWNRRPRAPRFTLVLRHPGALRGMLRPASELGLAEAYIHGDFDVEGDLTEFLPFAYELLGSLRPGVQRKLRLALRLIRLPAPPRHEGDHAPARPRGKRHSLERDRQAISYHYDISNEFFAQFLDRGLVYTCAYFESPTDSLEAAQEQKLDLVCRKLRLRPDERLLDLGCGWGGLAKLAAERYGAHVLGVTLSREQVSLANERLRDAGLAERAHVELRDFREVEGEEAYDKIAAVGIVEHLGEQLLPEYFARVARLLRPGGAFLNHAIARRTDFAEPNPREVSFLGRYVFPDGELTPIHAVLRAAEEAGLEVRDVESLREHYMLTLRHWLKRLDRNSERVVALTSEMTYRIYRLYFAGSLYAFSTGGGNLYHALFVKPDRGRSGLPLTRADWYR
jgi:cyclopropane-fatty-acyl-phospholipid synthase